MLDGFIGDDLRAQLETHWTKNAHHSGMIGFVWKKHNVRNFGGEGARPIQCGSNASLLGRVQAVKFIRH